MIVVADATPLRYLILIEAVDILPVLYERILIPRMVADELKRPRTPLVVRQWMAAPPAWLDMIYGWPPSHRSRPRVPCCAWALGSGRRLR